MSFKVYIKKHQSRIKAIITVTIAALVLWLIAKKLSDINFSEVLAAIQKIPVQTVLLCLFCTGLSYFIFICYDYLGTLYIRKSIPVPRVGLTSFLSYAFNFNLGPIVGAVAMRLRYYKFWGLSYEEITKLTAFCAFTSWFGYFFLVGLLLAWFPDTMKSYAVFVPRYLQWVGVALLGAIVAVAYIFQRRKAFRLWKWHMDSPSPGLLSMELAASVAQWLVTPYIVYLLFQPFKPLPFFDVMIVYLLAAVIALLVHIPGGLGVLEGTFVMAFSHRVRAEDVLAALLAFRALYYLVPLILAGLTFLVFELTQGRLKRQAHARSKT